MRDYSITQNVNLAIEALMSAGFKTYLVGGCVRDSLLGIEPHDYDLTTDATPGEVKDVFKGYAVIDTGIKHGTVTLLVNHEQIEITTFRTETGYSDYRHPDNVEFTKDIKKDLARRDFTINAIAYNPETGYCDPFGGCEDLAANTLKCVGNPDERFREDPLRILRAVRFSAVYGFIIDPEAEASMHKNRALISELSAERIRGEIEQILLSKGVYNALMKYPDIIAVSIPEIEPMVGFDHKSKYHIYDVYEHTAKVVEHVEARPELRWAALLHDVAKPLCFSEDERGGHFYGHEEQSAEIARDIFNRLKFDNHTKDEACFVIERHMLQIEPTEKSVKRALRRFGEDKIRNVLCIMKAETFAQAESLFAKRNKKYNEIEILVDKIVEEESCFSLRDLSIKGNDLIDLGYKGPEIGRILDALLDEVVEGKVENKREELIKELKKLPLYSK